MNYTHREKERRYVQMEFVGIFDSGFGGLTSVMEFRRLMPEENIIFFGDNARAPYGARSREEIRAFTAEILELFRALGAKAVLAACGTISLNAGDVIKGCGLPSANVLSPTVELIAASKEETPLGIIATEASVRSRGYELELKRLGVERELVSVPCPDFVTLIEAGVPCQDERVKQAVEKYLLPIKEAGCTSLLLGCTHYGIIEPAIREFLGEGVGIISAAGCGASALAELLKEQGLAGGEGITEYRTSGNIEEFRRIASKILGYSI